MDFLTDLVAVVGGTAAFVAVAAFLAKILTQHWLRKDLENYRRELQQSIELYKITLQTDLETHKAALSLQNSRALDSAKFEFEKELIVRRGEVDLVREGFKSANESEKQREDRLRAQFQRWALPIRGAIRDLSHRLTDILDSDGDVMLQSSVAPVDGWSADYDYFMKSTVYYFAQYFCWTRLLQQQLGHELFRSSNEMSSFFANIDTVSGTISRFPYDQENGDDPAFVDRQVFRLQQRALGELLMDRTATGEQIMTYREFVDQWADPSSAPFQRHVAPMEAFLQNISNTSDLRWIRLTDMRNNLEVFSAACEQILRVPAPSD